MWAGYVLSDAANLAKIDYPSALLFAPPLIDPIDGDTAIGNLPPMYLPFENGFMIPPLEFFTILVSRAGIAAVQSYGLLWTAERPPAPISGPMRTIQATATANGAAGTWIPSALTFPRALPNGTYRVCGMKVEGANVLAGRLIFNSGDQQKHRPGVLAVANSQSWQYPFFRNGKAGLFGTFSNTNLPQIEVIGTGAIATQTISLDIQFGG